MACVDLPPWPVMTCPHARPAAALAATRPGVTCPRAHPAAALAATRPGVTCPRAHPAAAPAATPAAMLAALALAQAQQLVKRGSDNTGSTGAGAGVAASERVSDGARDDSRGAAGVATPFCRHARRRAGAPRGGAAATGRPPVHLARVHKVVVDALQVVLLPVLDVVEVGLARGDVKDEVLVAVARLLRLLELEVDDAAAHRLVALQHCAQVHAVDVRVGRQVVALHGRLNRRVCQTALDLVAPNVHNLGLHDAPRPQRVLALAMLQQEHLLGRHGAPWPAQLAARQ
eukprot:353088-Chlamydomonas_euryale.AAC.5